MISRRAFLGSLAGGLLTAPLAAEPQPAGKVPRIGILVPRTRTAASRDLDAFREGLQEFGYVEGKNIALEYRWAEGRYDRLPDLAAELVQLDVDVIVTGGTPGTQAAKHATSTIPIVIAAVGDAVASGLVASLARPGGNVTGSSYFGSELGNKRLELLKEAIPGLAHVAVLANPNNFSHREVQPTERRPSLGVTLQRVDVREPAELSKAFAVIAKGRADALMVIDDSMLISQARQIAELAVRSRLPTVGFDQLAHAGGLMSYAPNLTEMYRRAASYVHHILKGARPADLPVEQPTKFELVINLKTARALGLTIPPSLLQRADQVIE